MRVSILADAARALEFLHRKSLIHRDIKSPNILLDSQHRCKIADFGMARQLGTDMTVVGTGASLFLLLSLCLPLRSEQVWNMTYLQGCVEYSISLQLNMSNT